MGGGKETPRQKMIGMMYLVLTALLAMNISKQILQGYLSVNESMVKSKENLKQNNERVTKAFEATINGNAGAKPYYDKALEAQKLLNETYKYIGDLRSYVVSKTEPTSEENVKIADTLNLRNMEKMDDYDMPTTILIGSEPKTPKTGENTASELKAKLNGLHDKLIAMLDNMQKDPKTKLLKDDYEGLKKKIGSLKPVDSKRLEDGVEFNWEMDNFYHLPLAAVYTTFNKMQSDVKNVEAEILQVLSGASGKLAIKFDHLEAKVIAPSSYIQAGQPYVADIFLAASSSKLGAGDLEVLIGADSASTSGGTPIPIENGMGKYSASTGGQGEQTVKGVIKFKKPDGTFDRYPFSTTYMVAAPAVAVEPEKMNVFYIGVDNPIAVSAAGVSPTNLIVNATGCGATKTGGAGGKFVLRFTSAGECLISTSAKMADGTTKPQGPPKKFRVKRIPDPVCKLGGKPANGVLEFSKLELATIGGVGADLPGFDFDVKFPVVSFVFSANVKGNIKEFPSNGAGLSADAKAVLQSMTKGGKGFFENVKVKAPDGSIRTLPTASFKVK
jgi:gliding motility-associated protein GldM